jgi:hypothetical protein
MRFLGASGLVDGARLEMVAYPAVEGKVSGALHVASRQQLLVSDNIASEPRPSMSVNDRSHYPHCNKT